MTALGYGKSIDGFARLTTSLEPLEADLGTTETPIDRFFVCSASAAPVLATDRWHLTIGGDGVHRSCTVDAAQLDELPQQEVTAWLECAGNGRAMFTRIDGHRIPPQNAHTIWNLSGMGQARWSGPRLRDVLELAGVTAEAAFVSAVGLDVDNVEGEPARMSLPLGKALDDATLVATHMNGRPLTVAHGAPARLVVPGWVGAYSVKWLGGLDVTASRIPSWRSDHYYVHRTPDDTITGPLTTHPVKSNLALPYPATMAAGRRLLSGYARSGEGRIIAVEWSLNGGPWNPAGLDPPAGPHSWTVFRVEVDLPVGHHELRTRATDATGAVQPEQQPFHPYGILWRSIIPHRITAT